MQSDTTAIFLSLSLSPFFGFLVGLFFFLVGRHTAAATTSTLRCEGIQGPTTGLRGFSLSNTILTLIPLTPSCTMSGWQPSHRHAPPPRIDLGAHDDDELDYSPAAHVGPSHSSSRHHTHDPRSTRSNHIYHDLDQPHRPPPRPVGPPPLLAGPLQPRAVSKPARTPSPEPDEDVLAYIRAQKQQQASSAHTQHELRLAQQLKRDKFQHGASRLKSRVDREREADERKRRQAEHDAQLAYHEFVAAMGGDGDDDERMQHSQVGSSRAPAKKAAAFVAAGGKAYVASRTAPLTSTDASDPEANLVSSAFGNESDDGITPTTPAQASSMRNDAPKRKRHAMDTFLSELQTEQAERESRLASLASATNTSISTLLAHETHSRPRGSRHTGDTPTTNICIVNLPPGVDERGVGDFFAEWGDVATVKIMWPRQDVRDPRALTAFVAFMTRDQAEWAFKQADGAMWGGVRVRLSWGKQVPLPKRPMYPHAVRRTDHAEPASKGGVPRLVINHRRSMPSTSVGEEFSDTGSAELYSTDSGEESETATLGRSALGPRAYRRLCSMLRSLTLRRDRIARITAFAYDHAAHYSSIVALLTASLLRPRTPVPRKLARLYALSDVLHNSCMPVTNAWRYRAAIEARLPLVFAHLGLVARSFAGRMRREEFKARVHAVLDVWDGWIVIPPHVLDRLRSVFDHPPAAAKATVASNHAENDEQQPRAKAVQEDVDGEALDDAAPQNQDDIDGEDLDGEDIDGEDLDGEAM